MTTIGFIGVGNMGGPMATHLVGDGHDVSVYDIRAGAMASVVEAGATGVEDHAAAARDADVVFLSLPGPADVRDVVDAMGAGLSEGTTLVDMTTSTPANTNRIAARLGDRGIDVLGAPVSGGATGAREGRISTMVGGDREVYERCLPLFEAFTGERIYVGDTPGDGHAVKLLNNYLSFAGYLAACEAAVLGERYGLDMGTMVGVFNASTGRNVATEEKLPDFVARDEEMGFALDLMEKDLRLLCRFAEGLDAPLLFGNVLRSEVGFARSECGTEADILQLYGFLEAMMGRDD